MLEKRQKYFERKELDNITRKAEPRLISHTDERFLSTVDILEFENEAFIEVNILGVSKGDVDVKL